MHATYGYIDIDIDIEHDLLFPSMCHMLILSNKNT